jgi:hypothetical protein
LVPAGAGTFGFARVASDNVAEPWPGVGLAVADELLDTDDGQRHDRRFADEPERIADVGLP